MISTSTITIVALGLVSFVSAAAPHDAGMAMNQGRMHRMARSRRGRVLAAPKKEVEVVKRAEECALQVSASEAAKWSSFVGQGFRDCTASSADLQAGVAMCYRLGFVDTQSGTFGGELTVWNVQGSSSAAASASSKDPNANITASLSASSSVADTATRSASVTVSASASSEARSSASSGASSRAAATTEVISNLNASATGSAAAIRMLRRAKGDEQSFAVTMKIGDADYRTSQIQLVAAGSTRRTDSKGAAEKNGTTISLANLQFNSKGMELLQSFHFVGQLPGSSTKTRRQANDINRDLSFGAADSTESKESSAATRARELATSSAAITTVTGKASASASSTAISAQVIDSLAPALKVLASSAVAGQMGNPTVIDLTKESAAKDGFATEAFGAFRSLAKVDQRGSDGTTALVSDSDCSLVIGGDDSTGAVGGVFTTTDFGSFFSSTVASSTASSTASARAAATTTSKASVASSASASASASSASASASASSAAKSSAASASAAASSASSVVVAAQGNPSSGPGIQVLSTGAIAASEASAIQATATAAAVTSSEAAPAPETQPTSAAAGGEGEEGGDGEESETSQEASATSTDPAASLANAEAAEPTATAFQLPGRSISVLPIGLGVFGGVSAVALIIVGWVTYERRKYKRMFADRSAAQAAPRRSGYGTV